MTQLSEGDWGIPRRKSRRAHPEANLQRQIAEYLTIWLPKEWWWTAFPAGGGGKIRGAQLKAMGLKPGVPDILIFAPQRPPLWIELKSARGVLSRQQVDCHERLRALGHIVVVCRDLDQVVSAILRNTNGLPGSQIFNRRTVAA